MKPSQVSQLLAATIPAKLPVLLVGPPGVGKSSLVEQTANELGWDLVISHPVVSDPTDFKGLPWPDRDAGTARFLPFGEAAQVLRSTRPTIWFFDDLGQAAAQVQAAAMQYLLARRCGEHVLPDHVTMVSATNRRQDRSGVQGILEAVKSRHACIAEVESDVQDFSGWAIDQGWFPAELIAYLRFAPQRLCDPKPTSEITNSPNPRTWAFLAKLYNLKLPPEIQLQAFAGSVGEADAVQFLAFLQMWKSLVSVDQILVDPQNAPIPDRPDVLYSVTTALATRANDQVFGRIGVYCERLMKAGFGEYSALCIRDCERRKPELVTTPEHTRIYSGQLGALMLGETI